MARDSKTNNTEELISVGQITSPHGVKGEVRVYPLTDNPARFKKLKSVFLAKSTGRERVNITRAALQKNLVILKFEGIDTKEEAEKLRNVYLQIRQDEVAALPKGHFYVFQIIDLPVFTLEGEYLGVLKDVLQTGGNDVYLVEDNQLPEKREILIPALKNVVKEIDLENKKITVDLPEGLMD